MRGYQCPACLLRGKTWTGGDPKCAFYASGQFVADNWNCASLGYLRVEDVRLFQYRNDFQGTVCLTSLGDEEGVAMLSFYKERGRVPQVWFVRDEVMRPLVYSDLKGIEADMLSFWESWK